MKKELFLTALLAFGSSVYAEPELPDGYDLLIKITNGGFTASATIVEMGEHVHNSQLRIGGRVFLKPTARTQSVNVIRGRGIYFESAWDNYEDGEYYAIKIENADGAAGWKYTIGGARSASAVWLLAWDYAHLILNKEEE